jgi:DNA-binding NarL/FixJ family response regulator
MFSADSSRENVARTMLEGARGFMAKPFSRDKLMEYISKCPTFS